MPSTVKPVMPARLKRAFRISAGRLVVLLAVTLALGLLLHALTPLLLALAVGVVGHGAFRLAKLGRALSRRHRVPATAGAGVWDELQNTLHRRQNKATLEKRRLVGLLRAFRGAAAALPDAVVALDREYRVQWFNDAAGRLLGLRQPHDLGALLTDRVQVRGFAEWLGSDSAEPLPDLAAPVDADLHLSLRLIHHGEEQSLLVARDVSKLIHLEQVRRDFVANVSHELRTPLTVVHGYLDMIEPEQFPEYESILHELRNQSRRMTQIVEDLLTLSRLEAQSDLPQERISMRSLLDALRREALALSQDAHDIRTELDGRDDLIGSPKELHSAFSNLVSNAVRYTPAGGTITLRWESDSVGGRLSVTDSGQGIAAQHLPRLTERFYRVSTSRSRGSGGTGLGLSIVKHVLQLHDARLEIRSEAGVGSCFSCVFGAERLVPRLAHTAPPGEAVPTRYTLDP